MNYKLMITILLVALFILAGCSKKDHHPSAEVTPANIDFNGFVKNLILTTADDTEPVAIDSIAFSFDEDAQAFDDIL